MRSDDELRKVVEQSDFLHMLPPEKYAKGFLLVFGDCTGAEIPRLIELCEEEAVRSKARLEVLDLAYGLVEATKKRKRTKKVRGDGQRATAAGDAGQEHGGAAAQGDAGRDKEQPPQPLQGDSTADRKGDVAGAAPPI